MGEERGVGQGGYLARTKGKARGQAKGQARGQARGQERGQDRGHDRGQYRGQDRGLVRGLVRGQARGQARVGARPWTRGVPGKSTILPGRAPPSCREMVACFGVLKRFVGEGGRGR